MGYAGITIPEGNVVKITAGGVVIWEKVTGRIPKEYQEVEYIYIPNTAYINTGWIPTESSLFNITLSSNTSKYPYMFGAGSNPRLAGYFTFGGSSQIYNTSNSSTGVYECTINSNEICEIETYSTNLSTESYTIINGQKYTKNATQGTSFDTSSPMLLGAWQYNATTIRQGEINLYYAKASDNGVPKFEMIPCYRKADGVIGMYDLVSKTLFTNAGSGSFTKGADV